MNLRIDKEGGFSLVEFLISSFILLVIAMAVFGVLAQTQRAASYQTEVQAVLDNTRVAMDIVSRYLRQAANDPKATGFEGITITSSTEVRVRSDLTGSSGPGNPDKGDPDGDTSDSGEDVIVRYNAGAQSIELVPNGGSAQTIANYISGFSMQYYDAAGATTLVGGDVRKIRILITGASTVPDPQTRQTYGMQLTSDVQLATRQ